MEKIGAHIYPQKVKLDFQSPEDISSIFPDLASQARLLIARNREIISASSDERNHSRYWEVPGFARIPCGGTHLKRTGEVGDIALRRKNIGKGKERIEVFIVK